MKPSPFISIILPIKAYHHNLEELFLSVSEQTYTNFEMLVIASEDFLKIKGLAEQYNFTLLHYPKPKNASRNYGSSLAKGEYLLHIDDDMILGKTLLAECAELVKDNHYGALAIPEIENNGNNFMNKMRRLEKKIVFYDASITSPRFIKKEVYTSLGGMNENLDPIDEGDLKEKIIENGISYTKTISSVYIHHKNRTTFLAKRFWHMYKRGQKAPLFNHLHPQSTQLKPSQRINVYIKNIHLLASQPFTALGLASLKISDLFAFQLGSMKIPKKDKNLIAEIKNKKIFEDEATSYQKEFFENTIGAQYVHEQEQHIVSSYLSHFDKTKPLNVLEIGPGGGRWTKIILEMFPLARITAYDKSRGMVDNLKKTFQNYQSRVIVMEGDMHTLPFTDEVFDLVLSVRTIKYASDQTKVFREINRVLKNNSYGIIELPFYNVLYAAIKKITIFSSLSGYANRITLLPEKKINETLLKNNFFIENKKIFHTIPSTVFKILKTRTSLKFFQLLNKVLPKSLFGRSIFLNIRKTSNVYATIEQAVMAGSQPIETMV
jgi:ubiquinone/menaquinone biosynthesis C-methylase UbiE